jgi:alpha-glucosidase
MPDEHWTRREFVSLAALAPIAVATGERFVAGVLATAVADTAVVSSPDGRIVFELSTRDANRLRFRVALREAPALEWSSFGFTVTGTDLGQGAQIVGLTSYRRDVIYEWRGVHSRARDRCNGTSIRLRHAVSGAEFTLEVRAFNDGVAFRTLVPGTGSRVVEESTTFVPPAGSVAWYHDLRGHYEGSYNKKDIGEIAAGDWLAPPVTIKLPDGAGYAAITEAAVIDYAGMALQADGARGLRLQLGHAHPASYPFTLRYGQEMAERLSHAAAFEGPIRSPWRVVMIGADLDALVNCDIVHDLSPPPDPKLFPQGLRTEWVKPGRAVWKYLDGGGDGTLDVMKEFSRLAADLGFEYNLLEGFWQRWPESDLRELVQYSRQRNVGIWLWKHSKEIRDPTAREAFFQHAHDVGAVGVKLDFFDHEAKEVMDLYRAALTSAAEHRLMVDFHGANKPTGESRTWPNEMTREAVSGMERRSMQTWSAHTTTIPFTRMLAGHLDFTPMLFGERRRETSWAHQIATAAMFTSPVLVYGAHPKSILENPAVEMIKRIPSTWDETRVLQFSEIGEVAAFAKRKGELGREEWFVVIANGPNARRVEVSLAFLGRGEHDAMLVRDDMENAAAVNVESTRVRRSDTLRVELREGGGFIARFARS